jgi:hypothetical protein
VSTEENKVVAEPVAPAAPAQEPVPTLEDYEALRRKVIRFRAALKKIVDILDELTDDEQREILDHSCVQIKGVKACAERCEHTK